MHTGEAASSRLRDRPGASGLEVPDLELPLAAGAGERYWWRFAKALALVLIGLSANVWIDGPHWDWIGRAQHAFIQLGQPAVGLHAAVDTAADLAQVVRPADPHVTAALETPQAGEPSPVPTSATTTAATGGASGATAPAAANRAPAGKPSYRTGHTPTVTSRAVETEPKVVRTGRALPLPDATVPSLPPPGTSAEWTRDAASLSPVDVPAFAAVADRRVVDDGPVAPAPRPALAETAAAQAMTVATGAREEDSILEVLRLYETAVGRKDPLAAKAVWPSLDDRALARAFNALEAHSLALEGCGVTVTSSGARARCHGVASSLPKVGRRKAISASHEWTFNLAKSGDDWQIESAAIR